MNNRLVDEIIGSSLSVEIHSQMLTKPIPLRHILLLARFGRAAQFSYHRRTEPGSPSMKLPATRNGDDTCIEHHCRLMEKQESLQFNLSLKKAGDD